ncbi:hypothetical protein ALC62_10546 [Cyphomyrmex costatus]|uniref:DDE-1 domain-containing protein n=1 Tax=Cyphomyrmex costatus TaxID=456900 RepID=A0A195CET7_9HYME|nr:hypothetical protein ALC62_10546 [Cyphomyrmex costatus]
MSHIFFFFHYRYTIVRILERRYPLTVTGYKYLSIGIDVKLPSEVTIILREVTGTFGPRVQNNLFRSSGRNTPNIFVTASKSGKLTSNHVKTWLKEVFFPNVGPQSVLLLDSWIGHCPNIISETKLEFATNIVFLTIPVGTFRLWKNFIGHFSGTVILLSTKN